jgi:transposase InsO family protein
MALEALNVEDDGDWIIDSGASRHFLGNEQAFTSLEPSTLQGKAMSAGGQSHPIQGQGSIRLSSPTGEIKKISSVYFVPGLNKNLLSVGQITELGCFVVFDEHKCIVATKSTPSRIVARGERSPTNGLYFLKTVVSDLQMNSMALELSQNKKQATISLTALESNSIVTWNPRPSHNIVTKIEQKNLEVNSISHASAEAYLWHRRTGHLNFQYLSQLSRQQVGLPEISAPNGSKHCDSCHKGKSARSKIPKLATRRSKAILEIIHSDPCGPLPVQSLGRTSYFITFTDDYSRKTWIYFMSGKDQTFSKFRLFKQTIEKLTGVSIKTLRLDRGGEYQLGEFKTFCLEAGIKQELTATYSPFQNGLAECRNRSILEKARSMMLGSGVPSFLWAEAAKTAVYLLNRSPTRANLGVTPDEKFSNLKLNLRHLRSFGCMVFMHTPEQFRNKLEPRSEHAIFVGYDEATKGYRVYLPHKRAVVVNRDVAFDESRIYRADPTNTQFEITPLLELQPLSLPIGSDSLISGPTVNDSQNLASQFTPHQATEGATQ